MLDTFYGIRIFLAFIFSWHPKKHEKIKSIDKSKNIRPNHQTYFHSPNIFGLADQRKFAPKIGDLASTENEIPPFLVFS